MKTAILRQQERIENKMWIYLELQGSMKVNKLYKYIYMSKILMMGKNHKPTEWQSNRGQPFINKNEPIVKIWGTS